MKKFIFLALLLTPLLANIGSTSTIILAQSIMLNVTNGGPITFDFRNPSTGVSNHNFTFTVTHLDVGSGFTVTDYTKTLELPAGGSVSDSGLTVPTPSPNPF